MRFANSAPRLDLREQLALAADAIHEGTPGSAYAAGPNRAKNRAWLAALRRAATRAALVESIFYWIASSNYTWFALLSFLNLALTTHSSELSNARPRMCFRFHRFWDRCIGCSRSSRSQPFHCPRWPPSLRRSAANGLAPSRAIAKLERNLEWLESSDNWFVKLVNRFIFWTPLCMLAIEAWRRRHGSRMRAWLASVGDFEALSSLSSFAYERSTCCFPTLRTDAPALDAKGLTHPLLAPATAVPNDVSLDAAHPLIIVSGPNMAGKSTLLRAMGLNVVLAQCGAPVCCNTLALSPLIVGASITVQDSLQSGLSRFYAEIQRLKQITDLAGGAQPTLFLLDELLSGTNSHDRRVGTEALLRGLLARNAVGLITTHDLALTEITQALDSKAVNMHFGDRFSAGELHFDYKLTSGIADSTNALQLMRSIGLEV